MDTCCTQLQRPAPHRHCGSAHQQDSRVCSASQNHLGTIQGTLKLRQHTSLVLCRSLPATPCSTKAPAVRRKDANSATSTLHRASTQSCGHVPAPCRIRLVTHADATIDAEASCRELPSHLPPSACVASPHAALSASRRPSSPDRCTQPRSSGPRRELQRAPTPTRIMHGSPAPETRQTRSSVHVLVNEITPSVFPSHKLTENLHCRDARVMARARVGLSATGRCRFQPASKSPLHKSIFRANMTTENTTPADVSRGLTPECATATLAPSPPPSLRMPKREPL